MTITLRPDNKVPNGISLDSQAPQPVVDNDTLRRKADDANYALGDQSPGKDSVTAYYFTGQQDALAQQAMLHASIEERQRKQGIVQQTINNAVSQGRDLSVDDYNFIQGLTKDELQANDKTILQHLYAHRLLSDAVVNTGEAIPLYTQVHDVSPTDAQETFSTTATILTKQQIVKEMIDRYQAQYDSSNFVEKGNDFLSGLIPLFDNFIETKDKVEGIGSSKNGLLDPGGFKAEEYLGVMQLPPEQFQQAVQTKVDALIHSANTPGHAIRWLNGLLRYSGSDQLWEGINNAIDVASVIPAGKMLKVGKSLAKANTRFLGDVGRQVVMGDVAGAAENKAFQGIDSALQTEADVDPLTKVPRPVAQKNNIIKDAPSLLDGQAFMKDAGSLANEQASRLTEAIVNDTKTIISATEDITHLTRITPEAFQAAVPRIRESFLRNYPKLEDAIIETRPVRESEQVFGGVDRVDFLMGKTDATPFKTEEQATQYAKKMYRLTDGSYDIAQAAGDQYMIRMSKHVDETDLAVQDARLGTDNLTPVTTANRLFGRIRAADDKLSKFNNEQRKLATYGASGYLHRMRKGTEAFGQLSNSEKQALTAVMDDARFEFGVRHTPQGPQRITGRIYQTYGELEQAYMRKFNRRPSLNEARAYQAAKSVTELNYLEDNVSKLRDKVRLGAEQHQATFKIGKKFANTDFFEAVRVDALPDLNTADPFGVVFPNPKTGELQFALSNRLKGPKGKIPAQYTMLRELLDSGDVKVLHMLDSLDPVWQKVDNLSKGEPVHFVVTGNVKSKPLNDMQVPHFEGGDWNYPEGNHYVKQAVSYKTGSGRRIYSGDKTVFGFQIPQLAKEIGESMEKARQMLVRGAPQNEVSAFVSKNLPFSSYDEFAAQFRIPGGNMEAPFDLNTPFVVTKAGERSTDVRPLEHVFSEEIVDPGKSTHSLAPKIGNYGSSAREPLQTVVRSGTEANPIFKIDHAQTINPLQSIQRRVTQMARNRFFEDYKRSQVEDWVKQFGSLLEEGEKSALQNPLAALVGDPQKGVSFLKGGDPRLVAAAKEARRSLLQFIGQETPDSLAWKTLRQRVVDSAYNRAGKSSVDTKIFDPYLWGRLNPAQVARSMVFHAKLGLLQPLQLFTQAAGTLHAFAIDGNPVRAAQSTFAYWAMRMMDTAPNGTKSIFGQVSKALGIDEPVLNEMHQAWRKSGMNVVEGEYGLLDDQFNPKMFDGKLSRALDAGTFFFREGNNTHRGVSFALSYLKWRQENPLAKLGQKELSAIVNRADLMYINMSRASNNTLQQGLTALPMQFFGYQARMMDQMLGKRLTGAEKLRIMGAYSVMWGVPTGILGTTLGAFWPFQDSARQYMLEHGIDGDANAITSVVTKGLGSMLIDGIAGEDFDSSNRFGPGGLSYFKDLIVDHDPSRAFGAGPSFISSLLQSASPFGHALVSVFNPDPAAHYQIRAEDFLDILKNISTFNNATRAWAIFHTGEWNSKTEGVIANVQDHNFASAVAIGLGLSPQKVTDAYLMHQSVSDGTEAKNAIAREVQINFSRAIKAAANGDLQAFQDWRKRATALMIAGGFDALEQAQQLERAMQYNESMILSVGKDFMLEDPDTRLKQYEQQSQGEH